MSIKVLNRVKLIISERKISQREFAKGIDVSPTTANKILNSDGDLSLYLVNKIAGFFNISEDWLLTGKGPKGLKPEEDAIAAHEEEGAEEATALKRVYQSKELEALEKKNQAQEEEIRRLRYALRNSRSFHMQNKEGATVSFVDTSSAIVYPFKCVDPNYLLSLPVFTLPLSRFNEKELRAFEMADDSMKNRVRSGDWVVAKKVEDFSTVRDNYVYVVVLEDEVLCRRVLNRIGERQRLRLKADNPTVQDFEVVIEQIKEVWEVKSSMTFKLDNPDFDTQNWIKKVEDRVYALEERMTKIDGDVVR